MLLRKILVVVCKWGITAGFPRRMVLLCRTPGKIKHDRDERGIGLLP
jgi:hypothetical protein